MSSKTLPLLYTSRERIYDAPVHSVKCNKLPPLATNNTHTKKTSRKSYSQTVIIPYRIECFKWIVIVFISTGYEWIINRIICQWQCVEFFCCSYWIDSILVMLTNASVRLLIIHELTSMEHCEWQHKIWVYRVTVLQHHKKPIRTRATFGAQIQLIPIYMMILLCFSIFCVPFSSFPFFSLLQPLSLLNFDWRGKVNLNSKIRQDSID